MAVLIMIMKVMLAPLLLALCTFAAWRWGAAVGGWLLGLPLISGPVSVLLLVEHGTRFAESAARGTVFGLLATGVFCVCYALSSRRSSWWVSLALSYAACLTAAWGLSFVSLPLSEAAALVVILLAMAGVLLGTGESRECSPRPRPGALAVRMVVSGLIVAAITGSAGLLGANASGLLAPLPVLLAVMVSCAHRRQGRDAARGLIRGALAGVMGGVAFFAVAGLMLAVASPVVAYSTALAAGLAGGAVALRLQQLALAESALAAAHVGAARLRTLSYHAHSLRAALISLH